MCLTENGFCFFTSISNKDCSSTSNCTGILLLFHVVLTTTGAFIILGDNIFYSLLTSATVLRLTTNCTGIPLLFHVVLTATEAFMLGENIFYSLLISASILQPSCHRCLHIAIIFKSVASKIFLQRCKRSIIVRRRIPLI